MAANINMWRVFFGNRWKLKNALSRVTLTRLTHDGLTSSVASLLREQPIGSPVNVEGWVKSIRKQKEYTFVHLGDGANNEIQVVLPSALVEETCRYLASVRVEGRLVRSPKARQPVEIQGQRIHVLGTMELESFPFGPKKVYPPEYIRQHLHLRPKTAIHSAILRLSSLITTTLHMSLIDQGFVNVFTPILTSNDCEGAGEVFSIRPASDALCKAMNQHRPGEEAYFDKKVFMTVSGQLHLEAIAGALPKVFTLGPTFRSENSRTRKHLAEFRMLEAELAFCHSLDPLLSTMEDLVKRAARAVLDHGGKDVATVSAYYKENVEVIALALGANMCRLAYNFSALVSMQESLDNLLKWPFTVMSYKEGMDLLLKNAGSFKKAPKDGDDIGSEHELFLVQHTGRPTFLVDWPAAIKPFYMRTKDQDSTVVSCVDLLVPHVGELCGGSLREHRYDVLKARLQRANLVEPLKWYLDLRKYGGSPTGGFGMGVERLIAFLLKVPNVKDVVPFPRSPHHCPM